MNRFNFIFLILASGFFIACDKDNTITPIDPVDPPVAGIPKIKTVTEDSLVTTLKYDTEDRIIEEIYSDGWKTIYTYEPGKVIVDGYKQDGTLNSSITYVLNAKGLCISWDDQKYERHHTYAYDADDRLIHAASTEFDGTPFQESFYYYEDGNRSRDSTVYKQSGDYYTYKYFYFTDIPNSLGKHNHGIAFWGPDNNNAFKQVIRKAKSNPPYFYNDAVPVLNSDSLIQQRSYSVNNGSLFTESYTYYND